MRLAAAAAVDVVDKAKLEAVLEEEWQQQQLPPGAPTFRLQLLEAIQNALKRE